MLQLVKRGGAAPDPEGRGKGLVLLFQPPGVTRNILKEELEAEGFVVRVFDGADRSVERLRDLRPDLVLVDGALESPDALRTCRTLRAEPDAESLPLVVLSDRIELKDKLAAFEAGATDYVSKPFFTKELLARLHAHLRPAEALRQSRRLGEFYLEMLWGVGSAISSPFSSDDEVDVILRQALTGAGSSRGALWMHDADGGGLRLRATHGYAPGQAGGDEPVPVQEKFPKLGDEEADEATAIGIHEDAESGRLVVPMIAKDRLIGGIEIELARPGARVSANDQKMLYALASQAAMMLENARLERDARTMFLNIIVSLAGAVDAKDAYTHGHSMRVAQVALRTAQQLGLPRERQETLLLSAILHDVGKIAIPDEILQKPGKLTAEEFETMKGHTTAGAKMLAHIPALEEVVPGIRSHHERWDGSGYPDGLAGEDIPLLGRVIHIGDAFDAITTDRVYRGSKPVSAAMDEIVAHAGTQFDPECVRAVCEARRQGALEDTIPERTPSVFELIGQISD